jgi:hypothetical protein
MRSIRRSRAAAGLLAAAFLVAMSGCGPDRSDRLASAPAPHTTDITQPPETTQPPPATADALDSMPMLQSVAAPANAPFGDDAEGSVFVPVQWLVPWEDGFLAVGVEFAPQPLPDQLPPEIADLFPPEVNALFPDGLPPTQQEATEILEAADLFDEVMDILNEHPEAMGAIQSVQRPDSALVASWSADGDVWTPTEMSLPEGLGDASQLAVFGDRLTIAATTVPSEDREPWTISVASTTDLMNWTTDSFEITRPEGLPEAVHVWASPIAVAANDANWVVRVMVDASIDPFEYLPEDVQDRLTGEGAGLNFDSEGVTVQTGVESSENSETQRYTWVELGVPETVVPYVQGSQSRVEMWSGPWDSEPTMSVGSQTFGPLLATGAGFLDLGERAGFSQNGQSWTDVSTPKPNLWFHAAAPLGDDVIAMAATPYGETTIHVLDATGTNWTEVEVPGLDDAFSAWSQTSSPAFILAAETSTAEPQTIVVEHDGFELTREYDDVVSYQLVNLSTGDVVAEESIDLRTTQAPADGPFEYLTEDMDGVTVTDPETGAVIVQIPQSAMAEAWNEARGDDQGSFGSYEPDLWLLATADGQTWLLEDLDEGDGQPGAPVLVAANGNTVLIGTAGWEPGDDGWQRFTMTE